MLVNVQDMIGWGLLVLPLIVIAWAACVHVETALERRRFERYQRFYAIMRDLGREDATMPEKMAAAYELREYREYRDVIAKIFDDGQLREETDSLVTAQLRESAQKTGALKGKT